MCGTDAFNICSNSIHIKRSNPNHQKPTYLLIKYSQENCTIHKKNWLKVTITRVSDNISVSVSTHWELQRQGEGVGEHERLGGPSHQNPQFCHQTGHQSQRLWLSSQEPHWTAWWGESCNRQEGERRGRGNHGFESKARKERAVTEISWNDNDEQETESTEQSYMSPLYVTTCTCVCKCVCSYIRTLFVLPICLNLYIFSFLHLITVYIEVPVVGTCIQVHVPKHQRHVATGLMKIRQIPDPHEWWAAKC